MNHNMTASKGKHSELLLDWDLAEDGSSECGYIIWSLLLLIQRMQPWGWAEQEGTEVEGIGAGIQGIQGCVSW